VSQQPCKSRDHLAVRKLAFIVIINDVALSLSSVLVDTKLGPKSFWVATAPDARRHPQATSPESRHRFSGISLWVAKSGEERSSPEVTVDRPKMLAYTMDMNVVAKELDTKSVEGVCLGGCVRKLNRMVSAIYDARWQKPD